MKLHGNTISATTPATLATGTANDIVVTSNGGTSTFALGWFSDFTDVPQAASYHDYVVTLYNDGITAGCGGGNYCPDGTMSRYTLSVYIANAMAGSGNVPASGSGYNCVAGGSSLAADVDPASSYCKFANFLMASGVMPKSPDVVDSSNGCATGNFCGTATVTRADMAVYMARAIAGSDAQVPANYSNAEAGRSYDIATPSTLVFTDVLASSRMGSVDYAKHVYYLWALNIVSGTSNTTYSPANSVTRGQMATFLAAGFHLPRRPATAVAKWGHSFCSLR